MIRAMQYIIIPAYNEEKRITKTLQDYSQYFSSKAYILVVINGCSDKTGDKVKELIKKNSNILSIEFSEKIGKGRAVREGFKYWLENNKRVDGVESDLIGFVDADEATSPEEYDRLSKSIGLSDGVIGSRFLNGSKITGRSKTRNIVGIIFRSIVKILFRLPFTDTQCGVKIFKEKVLKIILPELQVNNMAFDVELLLLANKNNFVIKEIPTIWQGQTASGSLGSPLGLMKNGWKMMMTLINLKIKI